MWIFHGPIETASAFLQVCSIFVPPGSLIASLAHTRAGIPDAIITSGAVDILITHLFSENIEVRAAAAVALGYLTFNRTATRMLLIATRNTPGLYKRLMDNIDKDAKIASDFTEEFNRQQIVGLPALRYLKKCLNREKICLLMCSSDAFFTCSITEYFTGRQIVPLSWEMLLYYSCWLVCNQFT